MVRGRKKDLTAPPTRQLTHQRDYRARKAQYLFELEQRCLRAEEENARLRRELEQARAAVPFTSPHEVVQVSSELLHHLANASASIARFQEITAPRASAPAPNDNHGQPPMPPHPQSLACSTCPRPPSFPCQTPSQPVTLLSVHPHEPAAHSTIPNRVLSPIRGQSIDRDPMSVSASPQPSRRSPSPSLESECCGGYIDCSSECCGGYFDCSELTEGGEGQSERNEDYGGNSPNHSMHNG